MYPHRIRLRGPWDYQPLARFPPSTEPLPPPGRMTLPWRWPVAGLAEFAGRVRFRRRFGYPGRIDPCEQVWLTGAGVNTRAELSLNGVPLGSWEGGQGPFECDVTSLLRPRNELVVEVEGWGTCVINPGGDFALEVRCKAYLRRVRLALARPGELLATGEVVGVSERPLDLYVIYDRYSIAYETVKPEPAGRAFRLSGEVPPVRPSAGGSKPGTAVPVKVELVDRATVWYTWEEDFCPEGTPPGGA